ncbi:hypothetical protein BJF88_01615 [Cellulosimicrobium sp. CUA-896]|nr:hypothetical protein [Cellulosimicrobium sp. CUA-896]OLT53083.1 hypothetical protein BJF88_01615 [Cellulosimicrobium sp. CUA-896]
MSMWAAWSGIESLKMTPIGSTSTTLPASSRVKPAGAFIHAFAATTETEPAMPASTMGTPVQKCVHGLRRRQPKMYTATKIASVKKNRPSKAKGTPNASPHRPMKRGHSRPNSKLSTVPVTAPTAKVTAMYFDQRCASTSAALSSCRRAR